MFTAAEEVSALPGGICLMRSLKNFGFTGAPGSDSVPTMRSKPMGAGVNS